MALAPIRGAAEDSDARLFAAHALALREAGVSGGERALKILATLPGVGANEEETLAALWRPFFANAIVKLGRVRSPAPMALYYEPLLDVAMVSRWEKSEAGYRVVSARALPGERLAEPGVPATLRPPWMRAVDEPLDGPLDALARITAARLSAFRRAHPAESDDAGRAATTFAADAADMRAALPRLVWSTAQRLRWTDGARPWLRTALVEIEAALVAGDPIGLTAAAPDTDAETAGALARLPAGFAEGLALDMTLEVGEEDRLLIGSLPTDGDVYVIVLCRLQGDACALRRFMLISLLG